MYVYVCLFVRDFTYRLIYDYVISCAIPLCQLLSAVHFTYQEVILVLQKHLPFTVEKNYQRRPYLCI